MTCKEQNKILNDKIEANNAQYNLDRVNAEISAYSSGDLPKYEYLTKKDLNFKPNAIEQAKFEYSPLGKVFIDGLDKTDKKEGLSKRLKNIEDKSNNQLLALKNVNKPAIRGKDDDSDDDDDDDDDDDYKRIVNDYKNNKIDYKNIKKEFNKINKRIDFYEKNKKTLEKISMYKNPVDKKDAKILKRIINEIILNKIIKKHTIKKVIDISWIDNT